MALLMKLRNIVLIIRLSAHKQCCIWISKSRLRFFFTINVDNREDTLFNEEAVVRTEEDDE